MTARITPFSIIDFAKLNIMDVLAKLSKMGLIAILSIMGVLAKLSIIGLIATFRIDETNYKRQFA